jgi:hypothetical protein
LLFRLVNCQPTPTTTAETVIHPYRERKQHLRTMVPLDSSDEKEGGTRVVPLVLFTADGPQPPELRSRDGPPHNTRLSSSSSSSCQSRPIIKGDSKADDQNGENLTPSVNASSSPPKPAAAKSSSSAASVGRRSYSTFDSTTFSRASSQAATAATAASSAIMPLPPSRNGSNIMGIAMQSTTTTTTTHHQSTGAPPVIPPNQHRHRTERIRKPSFRESEDRKERPSAHAAAVAKQTPGASSFVRVLLGVIAAAAAAMAATMVLGHLPLQSPPRRGQLIAASRLDALDVPWDRTHRELEWNWDRNVYRPPPNDPDSRHQPHHSPPIETEVASPLEQAQGEEGDRPGQRHRRRRNLLIVQIGGGDDGGGGAGGGELRAGDASPASSLSSSSTSALWLDISSRPNRAYAKQWGMDYVMIRTPPAPHAVESSSAAIHEGMRWSWPWHRRRRDGALIADAFSRASARHRDQFGLDVISVVQSMLDRQEGSNREEEEPGGGTLDDVHQQQHVEEEPDVTYDAIILIPNNAVIVDLDYDLLRLIPEDVLASLPRKSPSDDKAYKVVGDVDGASVDVDRPMDLTETVVLFNLRHPYARSVAREWSDLALSSRRCASASELGPADREPAHGGSNGQARDGCVQSGDARLFLQAIHNVGANDSPASLVLNLAESGDGFVGRRDDNPHAIKAITLNPSLSVSFALKSNKTGLPVPGVPPSVTMDAAFALQTAADSVCYRYYPKCEVL